VLRGYSLSLVALPIELMAHASEVFLLCMSVHRGPLHLMVYSKVLGASRLLAVARCSTD